MNQVTTIPASLSESGLLANLPTIPTVAMEILRVSNDADASLDDLAEVIERDPAIAVRVVKLANSPAYVRLDAATSVREASRVLGFRTVTIVALTFSLAQGLQRTGSPAGLDLELFWRRSITTAATARHFARTACQPRAEEAFLAGLLCYLGKLVLAQQFEVRYGDIVSEAQGWPTNELEQASLGFSSLDVTIMVLGAWGIPDSLVESIALASDNNRGQASPGAVEDLIPVIALALAADSSMNAPDLIEGHALVETRFADVFGDDESVLLGIDIALQDAGALLDVALPAGMAGENLITQARARMLEAATAVTTHNQVQASQLDELARENVELEARASTDALTGLANRRTFDESLSREAGRRARGHSDAALGIVVIDIDHFKDFNDTYGHAFGDETLTKVGQAMQAVTRREETLHRYGGEEFVLLVPTCHVEDLAIVAERLRETVEDLELRFEGRPVNVTISLGAACASDIVDQRDAQSLVQKADGLLYRAKKRGRNRVETSTEETL